VDLQEFIVLDVHEDDRHVRRNALRMRAASEHLDERLEQEHDV
jgi:hypothetical protein